MKILAFGEVMMRLNPIGFKKIVQTEQMDFSFTGTGLNILAGLAQNGYETIMLTTLPENNLGKAAAATIRKLGISDKEITYAGHHMGVYILELGYGDRPSEVTYLNRSHSAFNEFLLTEASIEKALEKIDVVHICGIALSTSMISRQNALKLVKKASQKGIKVCFDFNFRSTLNTNTDMEQLVVSYQEILQHAEIVFGSLRDLTDLLHITGESEEEIVEKFMTTYPIQMFAGTYRHQTGNEKYLQGFLYDLNQKILSEKLHYSVLDRIGTGDGYVAGVLTGIFEEWPLKKIVAFATHQGVLAHTTVGDSPVLSKEFVLQFMKNKQDVMR